VGSIAQAAVDASRNAKAVFAELSIPAMKDLEVQVAARYDQYDTASKWSPKVALRYEVSKAFMLRSSYSESFKMPALKQLFGAKEQGAININNESGASNCEALGLASDCDVSGWQVNGANSALKPEKGVTWNLGAAFEAGSHLSGTVDFWRIDKTDNIATPTLDEALRQGLFGRDPVDNRWLVFTNLANQAQQAVSGVDVDLRSRFPDTALGSVTLRNTTTYYFTNSHRETATSEWIKDLGNYRTPELRNNASITLEQGPWTGVLAWRYVGGFKDAVVPTPTTMSVPSYDEFDLSASYTGFKNVKVNAGIKNLLDAQPPYSKLNGSDNTYTQMGFAEIYNSRGRYFYASLNYIFK
jgi:iron complex outermembrane receptor protein